MRDWQVREQLKEKYEIDTDKYKDKIKKIVDEVISAE